jgi:hypothetical protein
VYKGKAAKLQRAAINYLLFFNRADAGPTGLIGLMTG